MNATAETSPPFAPHAGRAAVPDDTAPEDHAEKAVADPLGDAVNHTRIMDGGKRSERLAGDPRALDRC
jgi:hypothetical protein